MLFVLHAIDKPGALDIRQGSRPDHLEHLAKYEIPIAGPLLDDEGNMAGSCIFLDVEDLAAAQAFADQDPYAIAGLFESVSVKEFTKVIWP